MENGDMDVVVRIHMIGRRQTCCCIEYDVSPYTMYQEESRRPKLYKWKQFLLTWKRTKEDFLQCLARWICCGCC